MNDEYSRGPVVTTGFDIDDEAAALALEFITEATSAEHVGEDARDEVDAEENTELYSIDFTALDEEEAE